MELLDGSGEPIDPVFNNQLRIVRPKPTDQPSWMQAKLTKDQLARLLGEPQLEEEQPPTDETLNELPNASTTETPVIPSAPSLKQPTESTPVPEPLLTPPAKQTEDLLNQVESEQAQDTELEQVAEPEQEIEVGVEQELNPDPNSEPQNETTQGQERALTSEPAPDFQDPNSSTL